MYPSRVPVEGQVKDSESLHLSGDFEVEFKLINGTAGQNDRPCAVCFSEKLQDGTHAQTVFDVVGPKRFQTNYVLDVFFRFNHRDHLNRSGVIKALGLQSF